MSKKYKISFDKRYLKDLEKIHKRDQQKILDSILSLSDNPRPDGCKKLKGKDYPSQYRIRIGNYRVVYSILDDVLIILIVGLGHRKNVYN